MKPKPFQDATVEAVMRAFKGSGTRRFLVADEPGLGKTLVARQVLSNLSEKNKLNVLYVCANQPIAGQNVDQLLGDLPYEERPSARASADRPGLLPLTDAPSHERLCIYSLTPGTAFSWDKRRHKGRVQERAFACALLEHEAGFDLPWLRNTLSWDAGNFEALLKDHKNQVKNKIQPVDGSFARFFDRFCTAMRGCIKAHDPVKSHLALKAIVDVNAAGMRLDVTGWCRNSLAAAALGEIEPGLVIFDEFQRFRDLMTDTATARDSAEASIRNILTAKGTGRLLLLSATPYEALRPVVNAKKVRHVEGTKSEAPATDNDFFRLLEFLLGNRTKVQRGAAMQAIRDAFSTRESEIRRGAPDSATAKDALADLVTNLSSVMCRTERRVVSGAELHADPVQEREG